MDENKTYFYAGGVTYPLGIIISLFCPEEKNEKITPIVKNFLIYIFHQFLDKSALTYLKIINKPLPNFENIFTVLSNDKNISSNQTSTIDNFLKTTPYQEALDSSTIIIQCDVTNVKSEILEMLKKYFHDQSELIEKITGLSWLEICSNKLSDKELKKKFHEIIKRKMTQLKIPLVKPIKKTPINFIKEIKLALANLGIIKFTLKKRRKHGFDKIQYHLWIDKKALTPGRLESLNLPINSGYQDPEKLLQSLKTAIKKNKK